MSNRPEILSFGFKDDGTFPNSALPLLIYRHAFVAPQTPYQTEALEKHFAAHHWQGAWRGDVYTYPHYHSTTHEALAVLQGLAQLRLGGTSGLVVWVNAGDILVIPAGVAHQKTESHDDFEVMGVYPEGRSYDVLRGTAGERPQADINLSKVPVPQYDPWFGNRREGINRAWHVRRPRRPSPQTSQTPLSDQ